LSGTGTTPARIAPKTPPENPRVEHDHGDALFAADAEPAEHIGDALGLPSADREVSWETVSVKASFLPRPSLMLRSSSQVTAL
jgi:hypothetical protein